MLFAKSETIKVIAAWKSCLVYRKTDPERKSQTATVTSLETEGNLATVSTEWLHPGR